jgi:hypothetical protein
VTARRYKRQPWTMAEEAIHSARYPNEPTAALAREMARPIGSVYQHALKIGLKKSAEYLASPAACRLRRGDRIGAATMFKKGQAPVNKGCAHRPGWAPGRMKDNQFKKGAPLRGWAATIYQPIGSERISKDGYLQRKVNDDLPAQRRWRGVHILLWEAAHGPLPEGHAVVFINGDRRDIRLENLECITRQELMARNTVHRYPKPIAEAIQLLGALKRQIRRRTKANEEQDRRPA